MSKFYKIPDGEIISLPDYESDDITIIVNGTEIEPLVANSTDAAGEKHVPVVDIDGNKVTVKVGEVPHPMLEEHYINNVYLDTDKGFYTKKLTPGQEPEVVFIIDDDENPEIVYEYCNLHGLWQNQL